MAGNQEQTTLGALIASKGGSIKTGPFGTVLKAHEYTTAGVPLISVGEIGYGTFRISEKTPRVSQPVLDRLPEYVLRKGDIVFGRKGAVDRSARISLAQDGWFLGSDGIRLRLPESTDSRFMAYQLQSESVRRWILQHATGTTMPSLNQGVIERIPVIIPPLAEQRAIARILGALEDKVETNRRMNDTLGEIARALFRSWFVDFDPVRAKNEGRGPGGMDAPTAELFPSEFVDSELGPVPKGWRESSLREYAALNPESWDKATYPETIRYVDLSGTKWGRIEAVTTFERQAAPSRAQRVLRAGDTIVGTVRPGNGSYALVSVEGLTGSTGFAILRPKTTSHRSVVYLAATLPENIARMAHLADGGAYPSVRPDVVLETPIVSVPAELLGRFEELASPLLGRIAQNQQQDRNLAELRDELLPSLLSGELSVAKLERAVEAAT